MHIRIRDNNHTNKLIQLLIIAADFVVMWILLYLVIGSIPKLEDWNREKCRILWIVCTFALIVAEKLCPSVIHERVVGANSILHRSTLLVAMQTLLTYLMLRAIHFVSRVGWKLLFMAFVMLVSIILL